MSRNQTSGNNCYRPIPPHGKDAPSIVPEDDEDGYPTANRIRRHE